MRRHCLILSAICLAACGNSSEVTSQHSPSVKTSAPIVQTASSLSPMERGAKLYKRCRSCHTIDEGGRHKVGPNLWALYGSQAGTKDGFNYSKVMKASDVIWNDTTLDSYIKKPSAFMKGNRMSFVGIKKQEDRDALLLYLKAKTTP